MLRTSSWPSSRVLAVAAGLAILIGAPILQGCSGSDEGGGLEELPDTLNMAFPYPVTNVDVPTGGFAASYIASLVNDPLQLSGREDELSPALATSVDSSDPRALVFHLREGVKFSNGDPLTPEDIKWSIEHAYAPTSQVASYLPNYKGVEVTGPDEVTVQLTKPTPAAVGAMAYSVYVQQRSSAEEHIKDLGSADALPIGTGPYKFTNLTTEAVTLTRNKNYWGSESPIKTIKMSFIPNDNTAQLAMRSGSLQGDWGISNPRTIPQWQAIPETSIVQTEAAESVFLSMNVNEQPYDDIHVRKAIAYSVDREGLLEAIYHGHGSILKGLFVAQGFNSVAPSTEAANELLDGLPQYDFDPDQAKAELAQSSHPDGFDMTLPYDSSQAYAELIALNLKQNLESLGINVTLKPLGSAAYYAQVLAKHSGVGINLFATYPEDPIGGLAFLVGQANEVPYGLNFADYSPPPVETAWEQVTGSLDNDTRWQGVQTILKSVAEDVPYVPLFNAPQIVVLGNGLTFDGPVNFTDMINGQWPFLLRAG